MSTLATELSSLADAVRADHSNLDGLVVQLRGLCGSLREYNRVGDCDPYALIEEFESELIPLFAAEQAEEFFAGLAIEQPLILTRIECLQEEHRQIAEAVDQLLESARSDPGPELALRLGAFLDSFDAHERAEDSLMEEFFLLCDRSGGN